MRTPTICSTKLARMMTIATEFTSAQRPETATILRPTTVSDDAGGHTGAWIEVETVSARVRSQGMQPWEKLDRIGGRVLSVSVFLIAVPPGTDVRPSDRIRVDTLDRTYEVIGTNGPESYEVERTVQAVLLQ